MTPHFSLTKLMISHDLARSAVTNQIAFDQRDLQSTPEFERTMDCRCQAMVSKLENSVPSLLLKVHSLSSGKVAATPILKSVPSQFSSFIL